MTANEAYPIIQAILQQVQDPSERKKIENKILGAVESFEQKKARISAQLDKNPRYQIKPKKK